MFKRIILVVAAVAVLMIPSAANAALDSSYVKNVSQFKCSISKVNIGSGTASAVGGCKNSTGRSVPVVWKRTLSIKGADGYPCGVTPASGISRSFSFVPPTPSSVTVSFTVKPKKGIGSAKKSNSRSNASSNDICEPPLQLVADPNKSAGCVVDSVPVLDGLLWNVPPVSCPSSWGCKWTANQKNPLFQAGYNFWGLGEVRCLATPPGQTAPYRARTVLDLHVSPGGSTGCFGEYAFITHFLLPPSWGAYVNFAFSVETLIPGGSSDGSTFKAEAYPPGQPPAPWVKVNPGGNNKEACALKGWFPETY